ncbi:wings apart-like protein regulation of heterochromatin-domain-containing protein [Lophiotrema nucula]|uniref:Wings apart-like protein regulation of heterochromatin-domain-containing protein n=1 Tax=Lophiotrema nucula TaxID=690887 RepID=A0A6A5YIK9_9PLEO|nr:wings apart-like protein regulation of heterochromatin-domain-containing protein [Lophiotrema nucula]
MAMATSSTFTTAHRRKKLATYGKASRAAPKFPWDDDAPSPERPRKQAGGPVGRLPGATEAARERSALKSPAGRPSDASATRDIFDVPSEDDVGHAPTPVRAKKPAPKVNKLTDMFDVPSPDEGLHKQRQVDKPAQQTPKQRAQSRPVLPSTAADVMDVFDVPSSDDEVVHYNPHTAEALQPRPASIARPSVHMVEKSSKAGPPQRTLVDQPALSRKRGKTPQALALPGGDVTSVAKMKPANKTRVAAAISVPPAAVLKSKNKTTATEAKPSAGLDIFDVPSSDEDKPLPTPRRARPPPLHRSKTPPIPKAAVARRSPDDQNESDESSTAKKRKRQALGQLSHVDTTRPAKEFLPPQRSAKYQKKEGSISPDYGSAKALDTTHLPMTSATTSVINKPKRTRTRTVPDLPPAPVTKGQSSPARLHTMLAVRSMSKSRTTPARTQPSEPVLLEDETMYDIPESTTSSGQPSRSHPTGLVTPRQKQMFSNLLGDSSDSTTPGMPSISRLQLTDRAPLVGALALNRSSSDIPQSAFSHRTRLIDTLIQAAPDVVDSEDDDSESESDEETEEDIAIIPQASHPVSTLQQTTSSKADDMDIDQQQPASQPSQNAVHTNGNAKVTYAKQRSYLEEEASLDDPLFLAMGLDDAPGFGGFGAKKTFQPISDDEDDPTSQVRGIHELRRKGQNEKFQMEVQTAIDDISGNAGLGPSIRRTAMLELCTKMADVKFLEQFLDSFLVEQFLDGLDSKGEVIFDFTALVAVAFIVISGPGYTILEQISQSSVMPTFAKLLDLDTDINRIAKERKTNLSKVGRESVSEFRTLLHNAPLWSGEDLKKVSPQLVALKSLEMLLLGLRKAGNTDALLNETIVSKLLIISSGPCDRLKAGSATSQDYLILNLAFSILEAVSMANGKQAVWSDGVLQRLVQMLPAFFDANGASPIKLAIRLCMNLTNNKPKACDIFAGQGFIQPLMNSVGHRFALLASDMDTEQRADILESLIYSLGALINLAEFSDRARLSVLAGEQEQLVSNLVKTFLEGSERAAQADSLEESQTNVAIGYLAVFLGNVCLNNTVRKEVQSRLPHQKIDILVEGITEFIRYNERVDRENSHFEGEEGRETWQNFTTRLMLVVDKLQKTQS